MIKYINRAKIYFLKLEKTTTKFLLLEGIVEINFFHIYINSKIYIIYIYIYNIYICIYLSALMYLCIYLYINDLQMISIKYKSLNKNEIQPSKYIPKNYNPVFLDSVSFFEFVLSCCV